MRPAVYPSMHELGSGSFGRVYGGMHCGQAAAFKHIPIVDDVSREHIVNEVRCLASMSHPHIVRFIDYEQTPIEGIIVQELCGPNLLHVVTHDSNWNAARARSTFANISDAIDYLHSRLVVHRDLKLANIVMRQNGTAVLVDFGLAHRFTNAHEGLLSTKAGSYGYAAPEILNGVESFDAYKADIWSLGIILFVLLYKKQPFDEARMHCAKYAKFAITQKFSISPHRSLAMIGHSTEYLPLIVTMLLNMMLGITERASARSIKVLPFPSLCPPCARAHLSNARACLYSSAHRAFRVVTKQCVRWTSLRFFDSAIINTCRKCTSKSLDGQSGYMRASLRSMPWVGILRNCMR